MCRYIGLDVGTTTITGLVLETKVVISGLGVTGQMHGMVLLGGERTQPCSSFIGWQDQRCNEQMQEVGGTDRTIIVGSGNGVLKNAVLPEIRAPSVGLPLT